MIRITAVADKTLLQTQYAKELLSASAKASRGTAATSAKDEYARTVVQESHRAGEKALFVSGYLKAMDSVTTTLATLLSPLETGEMDAEEFRLVLPDLIRAALKIWDFSEIGLPELAAYAQAMYSEPEHAQVAFSHVFALARDLYLHRITEEDARRKLAELSQQPQP